MKKLNNSLLVFFASCLFAYTSINAQLIVESGLTADELAQILVGEGLEVSNASLDCADGASGEFDGVNTSLDIPGGIMLTSGQIENAIGPNDAGGTGTNNGEDGDPDLDDISSASTFDACVLEFDFVPFQENLSFRYVFGSEEYLEFVDGGFNDVFGFFISGGTEFPVPVNIALIPGTTTPVSIDNVNNEDFPEYFVCNGAEDNNCNGTGDPTSTIEYDGYTVVLTAETTVTPCETYTLKLAVSDAGDGILDSGVFLQENSLQTDFVAVEASAVSAAIEGFDAAVEGCVNGAVNFQIDFPRTDDLTVEFNIGGSAVVGEDYVEFPSSITIPAGEVEAGFEIEVLDDGMTTGLDSISISFDLALGCEEVINQTAILYIEEVPELTAVTSATQINLGENITLTAIGGGGNYSWSPSLGLSDPNGAMSNAFPLETTTYIVSSIVGDCVLTDEVTVVVGSICDNPEENPDPGVVSTDATAICADGSVTATANNTTLFPEDALGYGLFDFIPTDDVTANQPLAFNTTGVFVNDGSFPRNEVLYIAALGADDDGTGSPSFSDPCKHISEAVEVVFLTPVTFDVSENCDGSTGDFTIVVLPQGGLPAYEGSGTYQIAGDLAMEITAGETFTALFPENAENTYSYVVTDDGAGCTGQITAEFDCEKGAPVALIRYNGEVEEKGNVLAWATGSELNNEYFELERSVDGMHFETIALVEGQGTTASTTNYDYLDSEAPNGLSYYRLSQTDYDGKHVELGVITLRRAETGSFGINTIAPVPANDQLNVTFSATGLTSVEVNILDITGRLIQTNNFDAKSGINTLALDVTKLASGAYFVSINNGTAVVSEKFLKH
ncbi:MAG: choice-of-anchor L domain-containing protein [Chitinophagales bacterium]